jgi:hypothetical protein
MGLGCQTGVETAIAAQRPFLGLFLPDFLWLKALPSDGLWGPYVACWYVDMGGSTAGSLAIVHFGSVGRLCGLFERSKAT